MTKSDFLLSGNAMVSCNVLSCWALLFSFFYLFIYFFFFAGCQILSDSDLQIKKETEATSTMENCIVTQSKVSFVLRCSYESTLVVCAVARTVSRSV